MTRTQRLQPVIRHNDDKEQRALLEVARCQAELNAEEARLQQLNQYKTEYLNKKNEDLGLFSAIQLQEFSRFLDQLDTTIKAQQEVIELRQRELDHKREDWTETRIDSKKIHKVVEKLEREEFTEMERREQKALDEFSQRKPRQG